MHGLQNFHNLGWRAAVEVVDVQDDAIDSRGRVSVLLREVSDLLQLAGKALVLGTRWRQAPIVFLNQFRELLEILAHEGEYAEVLSVVGAGCAVLDELPQQPRRGGRGQIGARCLLFAPCLLCALLGQCVVLPY